MSLASAPPPPGTGGLQSGATSPQALLVRGLVFLWPLRWWLWLGTTGMVLVVNAAIATIDPFSAMRFPIQSWLYSVETLVTVAVLGMLVWAHYARRTATSH